jgi:lactate dehydrogenase-like 2-hydroxyacid dehydrogenase
MTRPKVLVTRRWPEAVERKMSEVFELVVNTADKPLAEADLQEAMGQFDAILPTVTDRIPAAVFDRTATRTRILANYGVGYAHIDTDAARSHGIAVTNTPDVLSECTADIAMTLLLMVARRAGEGERELREGRWTGWRPTHLIGTRVSGATLGIVGFGRIGQAMAQRAHFGFGMKILVQSRSPVSVEVLARYSAIQVPTVEDQRAAAGPDAPGRIPDQHGPGRSGGRACAGAGPLVRDHRRGRSGRLRTRATDPDRAAAGGQPGALAASWFGHA